MSGIIGVIADTHGLLRPEAVHALQGCDVIVHAGDIGDPSVLEGLRQIAPVHAVRGNNDTGAWAAALPETEIIQYQQTSLYVLHNLADLAIDPAAAGIQAVISGHSHRPRMEEKAGVLYFNPGSAGRRRFTLPIALGRLHVLPERLHGEIFCL
jgi:hypothetical protein